MRHVRCRCSSVLVFWILLLRLSAAADQPRGNGPSRPVLGEVLLGGQPLNLVLESAQRDAPDVVYQPVRVERGDFPLEANIVSEGARPLVRIATFLQGRDSEWQDHDGTMWLVLRFLDEANRPTSSASFPRRGTSSGWMGRPQGSRFQSTVETAVVPEGARKVQLLLVSGGPPRTTGFWALRRLRLSGAKDHAAPFVDLFALDELMGANLDSQRGSPDGWGRDGTGLAIPQIFTRVEDDGSQPMLALVDADPDNTGGWLLQARASIPVEPGVTLRFECEEIYSVGRGADARLSFRTLPVGNYVLQGRGEDEFGRPTGYGFRLPIQVLPPFYATTWFRLTALGLGVGVLLALVRYLTWRKLQFELQRVERQRAVEAERTRLARDIHDEMGARLTQISILARRALPDNTESGPAQEAVRQIQVASHDLATALDEIVWAANPTLDTLESFGNYLSQYAGAVVCDAGVRCRLDIPPILPERNLPSGMRHRLMMAAKAAVTNALKHANATEVRIRLSVRDDDLELLIADNGIGFEVTKVRVGNGIENLRRRLEEMGGSFELQSVPGQGTSVTLRLRLPMVEGKR